MNDFEELIQRAIDPDSVRLEGTLSSPPSFGVYLLTDADTGAQRYRFGSHPVRQHELEDRFGSCDLEYLFLSHSDAAAMTAVMNQRQDD